MQACSNFPKIYGLIDKSVFEIVLQTCSKTEMPPNPRRKEAIIILIESFFSGILQTIFKPLVSSKIPAIKPVEKLSGICNKLNIGVIAVTKVSSR